MMKNMNLLLALILGVAGCHRVDSSQFQEGDIIFRTSTSRQSAAVQIATHSIYSHMGIIRKVAGDVFVLEAVQPVKITPLDQWIKRGKEGHCVVKRLQNSEQILTQPSIQRLRNVEDGYLGKPYDPYFEWSDDRMYCSEVVWKIYKEAFGLEIGALQKGSSFDFSSPLVQETLRARFPGGFPMDETVISPDQMFRSDLLVKIYEQ